MPSYEQAPANDTGINVLIDHAHQASFFTMWRLPAELRRRGLRVCGSQAALDTVLTRGMLSRVRVPAEGRFPFSWRPSPAFNVVVTMQADPGAQSYLDEERHALQSFVEEGGGLIMIGGRVLTEKAQSEWPLQKLIHEFGASFIPEIESVDGRTMPALDMTAEWEVEKRGDKSLPIVIRRMRGRGRVVVVSSVDLWEWSEDQSPATVEQRRHRADTIAETAKWAAQGRPPVGGSPELPREAAGGGPIYPEREQRVGNVVVYFAKNQKPDLLRVVTADMPAIQRQIEEWLPSIPLSEPLYLILSAGKGGGWAVNAYQPKEVGIIASSREDILSIFAHELAHTMGGPPNEKGEVAGRAPHGNQGEAHAGWFQGKILAQMTGERHGHDPNHLLSFDPTGNGLDLAMEPEDLPALWGKGKEWIKLWWVFQKLDDRYGPTWYPRWRWVQHTRWQNEPESDLSWDEMVEDMSIAVGEDLFPFFTKIGTTLKKDRCARAVFQGQTMQLDVAPIEITPAGSACLGPIGDYKQPLKPCDD